MNGFKCALCTFTCPGPGRSPLPSPPSSGCLDFALGGGRGCHGGWATEDEDEEGDDEEGDENDDDEEEGKTIWETYSDETGELESLADKRIYVIKRYIEDVEYYKQFRNDPIHKNIMATKRKFLDDADENENLGDYEALRLAITKRQYLIYDATNLENEEEEKEENME